MRDEYTSEYDKMELEKQYYVVNKYAQLTHQSEESVRRNCRKGKVPGAIKAGRRWLIPRCAVSASPILFQAGQDYVATTRTYVPFNYPFPTVPQVVGVGVDITGLMIPTVAEGSFSWQAMSPGWARWIACLR